MHITGDLPKTKKLSATTLGALSKTKKLSATNMGSKATTAVSAINIETPHIETTRMRSTR
eukprot:Awhi_evm1s15834